MSERRKTRLNSGRNPLSENSLSKTGRVILSVGVAGLVATGGVYGIVSGDGRSVAHTEAMTSGSPR